MGSVIIALTLFIVRNRSLDLYSAVNASWAALSVTASTKCAPLRCAPLGAA